MPGLQGTPTTSEDESDDPQPEMPTPTQQDLGWADGGAEDEAQAIEMARREMEMVLQDTDSLETVGALKKSYGRVRGHLDSQIMRILQSKIDESEDWVKLFKQSLEHITQIETNFAEIEAECEVCSRRVKQWDTIKTFNRARNNVTSSLGELQLLRSLPIDIEELVRDMDDEDSRDEQLLDIHVRLTKLEETRARVISKHLRREIVLPDTHHLVRSFETVADIVQGFEDIMSDNMKHAVELAQESPSVLVRILRVIERQERIDRWWRQDAAKDRRGLAELQAKGEVPAEMGTQQGYTPKGWREKAKEWMQTGVEERFQPLMLEMHEGDEDISQATVEKMTELRGDLIVLYDEVAPCFPPSYNVFAFYVQHYHSKFEFCFKQLLEKAQSGNLPAGQSLNLMNWIDDYREALQSVGVNEPPTPSLASLTVFEAPLLTSHERMFSQNIDTLSNRILADDWLEMRAEEDETADHDSMYTTSAPNVFFRLLQTSAAMAFDLPRTKYALQMAYLIGNAIVKFQDNLNERMEAFHSRFVEGDEELKVKGKGAARAAAAAADDGDDSSEEEEEEIQDAAKARAVEEARADALAQLKHFAFAWMNNCQDLHDFTVNLQDYLNKSLYEAHEREVEMIETAQQQGGHLMRLASAPMGSPRKSRVDFEETATQFLRSGTHFSSSVTAMLWKREVQPLCARLFTGDEAEIRAEDIIYVLSDMLTNDLRYRVGHTYSERLGKELLEKFVLAYFDALLGGKEGKVKYAKEIRDGDAMSILEEDLGAMVDFHDAVVAHASTHDSDDSDEYSGLFTANDDLVDDEPSMSRVTYTLARLTKIWEYLFAMLTMEPTVEGLFLGFQNICSRDTSCPTKLCELILLRRDDCKKDLRNKIKGMMRDRVAEYKATGILCQLKAVQDIDDVLRREAVKAAADETQAKGTWRKMRSSVKVGIALGATTR